MRSGLKPQRVTLSPLDLQQSLGVFQEEPDPSQILITCVVVEATKTALSTGDVKLDLTT